MEKLKKDGTPRKTSGIVPGNGKYNQPENLPLDEERFLAEVKRVTGTGWGSKKWKFTEWKSGKKRIFTVEAVNCIISYKTSTREWSLSRISEPWHVSTVKGSSLGLLVYLGKQEFPDWFMESLEVKKDAKP